MQTSFVLHLWSKQWCTFYHLPESPELDMPPKAGYQSPPQPRAQSAGHPQSSHTSPRPGSPPTAAVASPPQVVVVKGFDSLPARAKCPHCHADIVTATHTESGTCSWIMCIVLCLVGCNLGCCLIPFCSACCQDVIHTCPNCNQQIARWNRCKTQEHLGAKG
ncbi:hypothetical protein Btru_045594 [Bulinus truncatus]|nr:hypothetical protein Btru_045594 [Bulinus truncatus]